MVKKVHSLTLMSTLLAGMFAASSLAADKVVVIPLNSGAKAVGDATADDVLEGRTFSGDAGVGLTGTIVDNGTVLITPTDAHQSIPSGYHNGSGSVAGDSDLVPANIKSGIAIFGVAGDPNVINSSSGDAASGEIMDGKKAWVDGAEITGSMATQSLSDATTTVEAGNYEATTLDTVDGDLAAENIKDGSVIFGLTGTHTGIGGDIQDTSSGDAIAADILATKKAWVDGSEVTGTVPVGANVAGGNGLKSFTITNGLYSGGKTATANDTNLTATNIKGGTTIFGVTGTMPIVPVAKTGQTTSSATGDDGDLQIGTAWPNPRFTDKGDGTVSDNLTGLTWLQNANCLDSVGGIDKSGGTLTWANALIWSNNLANGSCGLSDGSSAGEWRLPNVHELQSLIAYQYVNPSLTNDAGTGKWADDATSAFFGVEWNNYWSASTDALKTDFAWDVYLGNGLVQNFSSKNATYLVWPVRD